MAPQQCMSAKRRELQAGAGGRGAEVGECNGMHGRRGQGFGRLLSLAGMR